MTSRRLVLSCVLLIASACGKEKAVGTPDGDAAAVDKPPTSQDLRPETSQPDGSPDTVASPDADARPDGDADGPTIEVGADRHDDVSPDVTCGGSTSLACLQGQVNADGVGICPGDVIMPPICQDGGFTCPAGTIDMATCRCFGPPGPGGALFCFGDAGVDGNGSDAVVDGDAAGNADVSAAH